MPSISPIKAKPLVIGMKEKISAITVSAYIINVRMQNACELIEQNELSIKGLAFAVGYTDPLYFSREFKKKYGIAPKFYSNKGIAFLDQ